MRISKSSTKEEAAKVVVPGADTQDTYKDRRQDYRVSTHPVMVNGAFRQLLAMEREQQEQNQAQTQTTVRTQEIDGRDYFLLQHDTYGRDAASVIVDEKGTLYAQDVFDGFSPEIVDLIRTASAPVSVMPDAAVSVEDMNEYGYHYPGMVPMGAEAAAEYFKQGSLMVYALHPDGTETVVGNEKQLQRHIENGGLFGVDKPEMDMQ